MGFPGSSVSKETACIAEGPGLVPGSGRSLGEGRGNPLQYSCLENPMDREACWAPVHGVTRVRHDLATKPPLVLDATEYLIVTLPQSPLTCDSSVLSCLSCHWQFLMRAGELFSRLSFNLNLLGGFFFFSSWLHWGSEKATAPHSSTLAWKIPWMEEPGGLQSMGSLRVRYDWATSLSIFTFMHWSRKWQPTPVFLPGESQGRRSLVRCRLWGCRESNTLKQLSSSSNNRLRLAFFQQNTTEVLLCPSQYLISRVTCYW